VVTSREVRSTAAERLDRLPITSFHRQVTWLLGFVFFAELGGVNAFSFAAPVVMRLWGISVSTIGFLVSGTIVFGFLVAMFIQTFAPILYAYTAECYPTEIRNSGTGLAYGVGRFSNAFGPLVVAFLFNHYGYTSVFIYIAATWLVVAITIGGFGPLTNGQTLP
jgi:predicted MFS family arabinose efflux permease